MKNILLAILLIFCFKAPAQEFTTFSNGLLYSPEAIAKLQPKADSFAYLFSKLPPDTQFLSLAQGYAHYIEIKGKPGKAIADMRKGMPFDELVKKYKVKDEDIVQDILVVKNGGYSAHTGNWYMAIYNEDDMLPETKGFKVKGQWKFMDENNTLKAFYFLTDLDVHRLPPKYAGWLQYLDYMADTVWHEPCTYKSTSDENNAIKFFWDYLYEYPGQPKLEDFKKANGDADWDTYYQHFLEWNGIRRAWVDSTLAPTPKFKTLLRQAANYALQNCINNEELEYYVAQYISADTALLIASNVHLMDNAMGNTKQRQLVYLARMAANAANFKVFLRNHLLAMDYYCPPQYQKCKGVTSHIKELEALHIQVVPLLLANVLNIINENKGRFRAISNAYCTALAESSNPALVSQTLEEAIKDSTLDDYNRLELVEFYTGYILLLKDEKQQKQSIYGLKGAIAALPERLRLYAISEIDDVLWKED